jgi:hypothetical protein
VRVNLFFRRTSRTKPNPHTKKNYFTYTGQQLR